MIQLTTSRFSTDDEIALLTDYLWKRYEQDHTYTAPLAILFPFVTGVRAGELCAMKFSDISKWKFIQIKRQRVKKLNQDGELKEYTFVEYAKARSVKSLYTFRRMDRKSYL